MKLYLAAAGLCLLAAGAAAQTSTGTEQSVVVPAQKQALDRRLISPQEYYQYQGAYTLSNGQTLTLSRGAVRLYAQIGRDPRQEIHWQGDGRFSSADGSLAMNIVWTDDSATGELNYMPRMAGTPALHFTLSLAAR